MSFIEEIAESLFNHQIQDKKSLHQAKLKLCKKYELSSVPSDAELLAELKQVIGKSKIDQFKYTLQKKATRTASGVAVVAVMTSPTQCPHGRCIVCPGGPATGSPQSYTGKEPAALRGHRYAFDPYDQTKARVKQLNSIAHLTDLIIMGGTFTARPFCYQEWFVKRCFDAMNGFRAKTFLESKRANERAKARCVGLTIETRPDWARLQQVEQMLWLGATRVEIGVQSTWDDLLYQMERGHTVTDTILATRLLKDVGLKVGHHLMPGLLGTTHEKDLASFREVFNNPDFKPDLIKIYPTLVIEQTELWNLWREGRYKALETREAARLIAEIKQKVPPWIRIQRIDRDIPAPLIVDGVKRSNLREIANQLLKQEGKRCRCIRCREVGHRWLKEGLLPDPSAIELVRIDYEASKGQEVFLSFEDRAKDILIGYCRLRIPSRAIWRKLEGIALIRELKVSGAEVPIGVKPIKEWQHRGWGKALVKEAERIAKADFQRKRLLVLSGVGAREYFRKLGFRRRGIWMGKELKD
jgi:elongator complex protein 3